MFYRIQLNTKSCLDSLLQHTLSAVLGYLLFLLSVQGYQGTLTCLYPTHVVVSISRPRRRIKIQGMLLRGVPCLVTSSGSRPCIVFKIHALYRLRDPGDVTLVTSTACKLLELHALYSRDRTCPVLSPSTVPCFVVVGQALFLAFGPTLVFRLRYLSHSRYRPPVL